MLDHNQMAYQSCHMECGFKTLYIIPLLKSIKLHGRFEPYIIWLLVQIYICHPIKFHTTYNICYMLTYATNTKYIPRFEIYG
jgi:hypothetical protein